MGPSRKLYLILGYKCNEACLFCGVGEDKPIQWPLYKQPMYDYQSILDKIDQAISDGFGERDLLEFSGGEPTIHPRLFDVLRYTRARFQGRIYLFSNGLRFADKNFTKEYASLGVDRTIITLHSSRKDEHDEISQLKNSFERTIQGLNNLSRLKVPVAIKFIVNAINFRSLPSWAGLVAKDFPGAFFMINGLAIWGQSRINKDRLSIRHSAYVEQVSAAADIFLDGGHEFGLFFMPTCLYDPKYWSNFGIRHFKEAVVEAHEHGRFLKSKSYADSYDMPKVCDHCILKPRCTWSWRPYEAAYGLSELSPFCIPDGYKADTPLEMTSICTQASAV